MSDEQRHSTESRSGPLSRLAGWVSEKTGSSAAFALAAGVIVVWLVTGPIFHFGDTWQLVINTATTIVTFLMVFLIQRSQNKSALAVQLKLNEIVAALDGASNRLISVEDLSEEELNVLYTHYQRLAEMSKRDSRITQSHSIDEAEARHARKLRHRKGS
ncbi:MAG: low affinity iron permease family protein [Acidobacteria bacterium]|nr:MAG: low affinity iron permease family protein [Acidobacteriota bacterium]